MSNQRAIHDLIRSLAGSDNKIVAHRSLCEYMGSLEGGVFLSQLLYWSDKGKDGWFYKSYKEWEEEIYLTEYQVKKCARLCVERGFLETEVKKANGAPTVHYQLCFDKFLESILKNLGIHSEKFEDGFPEFSETYKQKNTTKNTAKSTTGREGARAPVAPSADVEFVSDANPPQQEPYGGVLEVGKVAAGTGDTPARVFHEVHSVDDPRSKLSDASLKEIAKTVKDLDLWREVVIAWALSGNKPTNIRGQLDWYKNPTRFRETPMPLSTARASPNGHLRGAERSMATMDAFEAMYGDIEITPGLHVEVSSR